MAQDLEGFIDEVAQESHLRVEADLGGGFVRLRTDEAERRQAKHDIRSTEDAVIELLRNSRDAGARNVFLATCRSGSKRLVTVVDDGCGIPAGVQDAVFQARVTSKLDTMRLDRWGVHGRGMALFSIRENAEEARVAASAPGMGTALFVRTDVEQVGERTDQSSMPELSFDEENNLTVRGPRNVNRTVVEFALAEQDACTVYLGSPVEVAATLYAYGVAATTPSVRAFVKDPAELPVTKRLALAVDPADFARIAESLGLSLSERSARRAMDGSVAVLAPLVETLSVDRPRQAKSAGKRRADVLADARGLKVSREDKAAFEADLSRAWRGLAASYYLDGDVAPQVTVRKDAVHVTFPVRKLP